MIERTLKTLLFLLVVSFSSCKETNSSKNKQKSAPVSKAENIISQKQISEDSGKIDTDKTVSQQSIPSLTWNGKYFGTFLRLKDEYADPRAWGQIKLDIHDKKAIFVIDSYVEILKKNMEVISQSPKELKLKDPSTGKSLTLTRTDQLTLEGNLMESIVGEQEKYKIEKQ
ncbi:hypothetical protein [Chryseobacterium indologenes]|uniref:Lipoprotein n=1 Tax=Chryseobacterium indologenes TaxID=253 RepID=A0A0N0IUK3_CHRID|nr:hypothetical protein [Chryseobacterium indologenes]KPE49721.1 hypothetical protein AOB46_18475 [Chryseobacterium indologenes]